MTTTEPQRDRDRDRQPGYRGALPPREDRLARPWILAVFAIFVLVFVLSFLGVPSRFIPEPTPVPLPSVPAPSASSSVSASGSVDVSASASASASESAAP
jgi:hypothetical protein